MNLKWIRTRKKSLLWRMVLLLLMVVAVFAVLSIDNVAAAERGDIELCDNLRDDDGDGDVDEAQCQLSPTSSPTSGNGIVPEAWNDNPTCADMGYGYGFKLDGAPNGTFTLTGANGELTGGAPSDSFNTVTVSSNGTYLTWSSTLAMDAVFIKGGPVGGNLYVYEPESKGPDSGLATPTETGISHVEFCYDYELNATKTAKAEYARTYTWDITKSVDPNSHIGWFGDTFSSDYDVFVDQMVADSDYKVTGQITINNPTPFQVGFSVVDNVDGTVATVDCHGDNTLDPGETRVCNYFAELGDTLPPDGTNVATITSSNPNVDGATAEDPYAFGDPTTIDGYPEINVTDYFDGGTGEALGSASGDYTFEYSRDFECPTDKSLYFDGVYTDSFPNYAEIDQTGQQDDANVNLTCYIWDVSKTADGTYDNQYRWEIDKAVDPESQSGFAGDTLSWTWSITWESFLVGDVNHEVSGVITVDNPAPLELTVQVEDYLTGNFPATVTCNDGDRGTNLTIAAQSSGTCNYTAEPNSQLAQNTAEATRNGVTVDDTVNVNWTKSGDVGLDATIMDSNHADIPANSAQPYKYTDSVDCSTNDGDYGADGSYSGSASNTATITWTSGSDESTADTDYTCYIWDVSKTADGTYQDKYRWEINKTVDPPSQTGYPGDTLEWTWSITWESFFVEEVDHAVSGVITVDNPAPLELTVDVTDYLSGNFAATVSCNDGNGGTDLTIAANSSGTCNYTAEPEEQLAQNTATATRNGVTVDDTVDVTWTKTGDVGLDATISDSNKVDIPVDSNQPFEYTDSIDCSTEYSTYGPDGSYSGDASNTATITWTGGSDESTADTSWTCETSYVDVLKLTNGVENPEMTWSFELRKDGSTIESLSTPPTLLKFQTTLRPGDEYTLCETGIPPSWTIQWALDSNGNGVIDDGETLPFAGGEADLIGDGLLQVYDPDPEYGQEGAVNDTRCVNFLADSDAGDTVSFIVDNQRPGGEPRTPGYWKNWNTCTGGNQQYTAAANGGVAEGWFLLDDLIPTTVGDFEISTCEIGVDILDKRAIGDPELVGDGMKMASDPAFNLATALLAAKLNLAAGAETCSAVVTAVSDADALLSSAGFDGNPAPGNGKKTSYWDKKDAEYQQALDLQQLLDDYNNGLVCSP